MTDYISREEVLEHSEYTENFNLVVPVRFIKAMKAADVQPVRRGGWEMYWQNGKPKLKCTNCHTLFDIRTNDKHICIYPKFCEECGADMRGEGHD